MRLSSVYALTASLSSAAAVSQGFNYGSTKSDGTFNYQADYESLFSSAKNLVGTGNGFTSARLYTMIQGGSSTNEPTQAIPAAIKESTTLLLGLWASGGSVTGEIAALQSAISTYGDDFAKLVVGISVGSEDLYRNSATGKAADAGVGVDAATIASYLVQVKDAVANTILKDVPIGHVDTWTAWAESDDENLGLVIGNCSFIGVDAYPYFQNTMSNSISDAKSLFNAAIAATKGVVGDVPVWITETGFPVSGKTENLAIPSIANAKTYWDEVGCPNFGSVNTWWYTLQDSNPVTPNPSFGVIGSSYSTTPLFDLSCSDVSSSTSAAGSSSTSASSGSATSAASSVVSAASSGAVASSGSGLSPSEGAGNGVSASTTATGSTSSATGVSGSNSTVPAGTSSLTTATKSGSSTSTSSVVVSTNAASVLSGSFAGAIGALFVAVAAL